MTEQRVWLKSRKKSYLRVLAGMLSLGVLLTANPNIVAALSVFAAEESEGESRQYVSGFAVLPEDIREQSVSLGGGVDELSLPDTLEAVVTRKGNEDIPEEDDDQADDAQKDDGGLNTGEITDEDKAGLDKNNGENGGDGSDSSDETDGENGRGENDNTDEAGNQTGDDDNGSMDEAGDQKGKDDNDSTDEARDENDKDKNHSTNENDDENSQDENNNPGEIAVEQSQVKEAVSDATGWNEINATDSIKIKSEKTGLRQETHTVTIPEYQAENIVTVEEKVYAKDDEETILIEGVTWHSEPDYDENTVGVYLFTASLPEEYDLAEGVSLPKIRVTVGENILLFIERAEALPALEAMLDDAPGEEEEGYEAWEERFLEAVSEAEALRKEYDAFTEAEQAQIPEEIYTNLVAWWEYARMMEETDLYAEPPAWGGTGYAPVRGWGNELHNKNAVYALGNNLTLKAGEGDKTKVFYTGSATPIDLANLGEISSKSGINYSFQGDGDVDSGFDLTDSGVVATWSGDYYGYQDEETGTGDYGELVDVFKNMDVKIHIEGGTLLGLSNVSPRKNNPNSATLYMTGGTWLGGDGVDNAIRANAAYVSGGCMKGPIKIWFGLYLSGSPIIGEEGGGLWMSSGSKFYLDGPLSSGAEIYINPQADFADGSVVAEGSGYTITESDLAYLHLTGDNIGNRELKLVNNQILLVAHTHTLSYAASGAVITETCADNCGHSATATLSVKSGEDLTYTGSALKPATVTYSDNWAGTGTDRPDDTKIQYTDNTNAGTATAKLTIGGRTAAVTFEITKADMAGVTASGYTGTYDAAAHGITVNAPAGATVKYRETASGNYTLTANPGYTNIGTYTVYYQITRENYNTVTGSAQVKIDARNISGATVTLDGTALTYTGLEQTKGINSVTITAGAKTLTLAEGTDYAISGNKGTAAGTYTMTLTGKGNYTGIRTAAFQIVPKTLTDSMVVVPAGPHYYTGSVITPAVTVKDGIYTLTKDTDYTVTYQNNTNAGTATVTVEGKGNYKGTAGQAFTIQYRPLPADKSLADYVTVSPAPVEEWYSSDITLSPKGGSSVGETPAGIGNTAVIIADETGTDGSTKTIYVKDENGNIYQTAFPYKLDKTPPVIDLTNMTVTDGSKNVWHWIIGKKSMIIRIPENDITDTGSGVGEVTYTAVPDSGEPQTQTIQSKSGYYEIALNREFTGTIRLTAKDRAGNTTQVSLTADGGKVIAEDYAPVVTISLPDTPTPNENGWYNAAIPVTVTVTDDKDDKNTAVLSGGLARIVWKDGENGAEQTVSGLPGASPVYEKTFIISVDTDGTHTYYVKAADNAGNESGWQTVTVKCDTGRPVFNQGPAAINHTQEGADITFIPSEGGKVYWLVDPAAVPNAQEVAEKGAQNGNVKENIIGGSSNAFSLTGLTSGENHKVYVVLEDAAGNLSDVKEVSFISLQKAPEVTADDIVIDPGNETVKLPDRIGEVEVYTDSADPAGSGIRPDADGCLPVEPGTTIYIRYPEKTQDGETTPASDSVTINIPARPAVPSPKQVTVTDTTITVANPVRGEEYILVPKGSVPAGQEPDWSGAVDTGTFTGLNPNQEYELWVRKKATEKDFASDPVRTELCTKITVRPPVVEGEGAGKPGNTAKPPVSATDEDTVPFTGTYGEEYTPIIKVDGQEYLPEMTWSGTKGEWEYTHEIPDGASEVEVTVEFRKRTLSEITVTPDVLKLYADHEANRNAAAAGNLAPLTDWLREQCRLKAAYDNGTKETVQEVSYATTGQLTPKGGIYDYSVSAEGKTTNVTLTVEPVNAAVTVPSKVMQRQKDGGYTQAEVTTWLPAQAAVTYTRTGYAARKENRAVTWNTAAIGADFGGTLGEQTISGTVDLPVWATGQAQTHISIEFVDKVVLTDAQMTLAVSGWTYGAQEKPAPRGSVSVTDTNPVITYLYSADAGVTWQTADQLPRSGSGHIIPGEYQVNMRYTSDSYTGTKTTSFTVGKRPLTVLKGTLEAENKNYDGTLTATLKAGGTPVLSGVITGDMVSVGGSLRAVFAEAGPKKNIAVTVTGFTLEGRDADYYNLGNTSLALQATINHADGTPPADSQKPGSSGNKDKDKEHNGNGDDGENSDIEGDNGNDDNSGSVNSGNGNSKVPGSLFGTPAPEKTQPPAEAVNHPGQTDTSARRTGESSTQEQTSQESAEKQGNREVKIDSAAERQAGKETDGTDNAGQPESETVKRVMATVDEGRIVVSGETLSAGNVPGMEHTGTAIKLGEGTVLVTVVCAQQECTAGVADTAAVANAVLTPEQQELVNGGETIEVRIDVTDISKQVPAQDQKVIASGIEAYEKEVPGLVLGMYVDISMFIKIGEEDWNPITEADEPIEVVIGIPERLLQSDGREFYIIRAHEGEYTFMSDMDDTPDTITISTDRFSSYAIAYTEIDTTRAGGRPKCGLCHICPTFLGICCFIWLVLIAVGIAVIVIWWRRIKKEPRDAEK